MSTVWENVKASTAIIAAQLRTHARPVVLSSFGKDSLVLLDLIYQVRRIPVLTFLQAAQQFPDKYAFAMQMIAENHLNCSTLPPQWSTHVQDGEYFEIFKCFGSKTTGPLLMATGCRPRLPGEEPFLCALEEVSERPNPDLRYDYDLTFIGAKSSDDVKLAERSTMTTPVSPSGSTTLCFPLWHWTDEDIWAYIKDVGLPYDRARYDDQREQTNPDQFPTCWNCLDTRKIGKQVFCPSMGSMIPNRAQSKTWHTENKLRILGSVEYLDMSVRLPDPEPWTPMLPPREEWPLFSIEKYIANDRVYLLVDDVPPLYQHVDGLPRLHEEWTRLERACRKAGIVGWLCNVDQDNRLFRRWLEQTGATLYAERDGYQWFQKLIPAEDAHPTLKQMATKMKETA